MELQALRYAAMISTMTFEKAEGTYREHLEKLGRSNEDPQQGLLEFLDWDNPNEKPFAKDVRMILVSSNFSKELTTTVLWLNEREIDIRCVRLQPYSDKDRILLDVQQVIPLPETKDYQTQLREQKQREKTAERQRGENTKLLVEFSEGRDICKKVAADTFVEALKHMGLKRILDLDPSDNRLQGRSLVSRDDSEGLAQKLVEGLFVETNSSTKAKKECLDHIAKKLGIEIKCSVLSPSEYQTRKSG